jgi:adenosylmethionine-8-amino-7-oxononanoate aminotransferase
VSIYEDERLLTRANDLTDQWQSAIHGLKELPNVVDIRALGLLAGSGSIPQSKSASRAVRLVPPSQMFGWPSNYIRESRALTLRYFRI